MQIRTINSAAKNVAIVSQLQLVFWVHKLQHWTVQQKSVNEQGES